MGWREKNRPEGYGCHWPGRKGGWGDHWHRFPRTTQERRAVDGDYDWVRPKRRRLPDARDEIPKSSYEVRTWKWYRDHQWKSTTVSSP